MASTDMIKNLSSLVQLDIDASHAYDQAIEQIDTLSIRNELIKFRGDHERHIDELSALIRKLGGTPPERSRDFKGYLIEGFTALRSSTGTEGALKAMQGNEKLTNKQYDKARSYDLTPEAKTLVERNYLDEVAHLKYIESVLAK